MSLGTSNIDMILSYFFVLHSVSQRIIHRPRVRSMSLPPRLGSDRGGRLWVPPHTLLDWLDPRVVVVRLLHINVFSLYQIRRHAFGLCQPCRSAFRLYKICQHVFSLYQIPRHVQLRMNAFMVYHLCMNAFWNVFKSYHIRINAFICIVKTKVCVIFIFVTFNAPKKETDKKTYNKRKNRKIFIFIME